MSLLLLAHRGANRLACENTLAAFRLALETGCDGCECDGQLSHDGTLIVFHDETLQRLAGLPRSVPELTVAQLAAVRLVNPAQPLAAVEGGVPTLEAVWQMHRERRKHLFVELKYFHEHHTHPTCARGNQDNRCRTSLSRTL